jgi:PAT family acetyl-CoA transporter-like MFS transporter 1
MKQRQRKRHNRQSPVSSPAVQHSDEMPRPRVHNPGLSTSLDSVQVTPRTPRTARGDFDDVDTDYVVGSRSAEEVEMSLLGEDERRHADAGFAEHTKHKAPLSSEDKRAMVLLCILCTWISFAL